MRDMISASRDERPSGRASRDTLAVVIWPPPTQYQPTNVCEGMLPKPAPARARAGLLGGLVGAGQQVLGHRTVVVEVAEQLVRPGAVPQHSVAGGARVVRVSDGDGGGLRIAQSERHLEQLVQVRAVVDRERVGGPEGGGH